MNISSVKKILIIQFFVLLLVVFFSYQYAAAPEKPVEKNPAPAPFTSTNKNFFESASVEPDTILEGPGKNIDSPEFFAAGEESLIMVSAKNNDVLEVWKYPFKNTESSLVERDSLPNGLGVDQDLDLLLIGDSEQELVEVRSLPELQKIKEIGKGVIPPGETNVDVLTLLNGEKHLYATGSQSIHVFNLATGATITTFSPNVESVEEVLADSYHQIIYVPEESGKGSEKHPGGAITAYAPDGTPYLKNGTAVFGKDVFSEDGEGITLYTCRNTENKDTGRGFIIASDQRDDLNDFEFFDRETWEHLGTLRIKGVSFTDGIVASSYPLPGYPQGIFVVVNNDQNTALVSWEKIAAATGVSCE